MPQHTPCETQCLAQVGFWEDGLESAGGLTLSCSAGGSGENCLCSPCFMRYIGRSFKKHKRHQAKLCLKPFSGFPLKSAQNPDPSRWPVRPGVVHGSCLLSFDLPAPFHPNLCAHHIRPSLLTPPAKSLTALGPLSTLSPVLPSAGSPSCFRPGSNVILEPPHQSLILLSLALTTPSFPSYYLSQPAVIMCLPACSLSTLPIRR